MELIVGTESTWSLRVFICLKLVKTKVTLHFYGIELKGKAGKYQKSLLTWPLLQEAIIEAKLWVKK